MIFSPPVPVTKSMGGCVPPFLYELLPYAIADAVRREGRRNPHVAIEEIRLRRDAISTLTTNKGNLHLPVILGGDEMDETFRRICGGSLYAHAETIREGYVSLQNGVRVGIVGRAALEEGRVIGVYDPSALVFRIPVKRRIDVCQLLPFVEERLREGRGILLYAPPRGGKTTILRSLIYALTCANERFHRVAVIDTRGEIGRMEGAAYDLLTAYPRALGLEIAHRTMGEEIVACDEIGDEEEAREILAMQNSGTALLATAHGMRLHALLRRPGIRMLHTEGVFGGYIGIHRVGEEMTYHITKEEEIDVDR